MFSSNYLLTDPLSAQLPLRQQFFTITVCKLSSVFCTH